MLPRLIHRSTISDPVNLKLGIPRGISYEGEGGSPFASFQSMTGTSCRLGKYKMHTTHMNMGGKPGSASEVSTCQVELVKRQMGLISLQTL